MRIGITGGGVAGWGVYQPWSFPGPNLEDSDFMSLEGSLDFKISISRDVATADLWNRPRGTLHGVACG